AADAEQALDALVHRLHQLRILLLLLLVAASAVVLGVELAGLLGVLQHLVEGALGLVAAGERRGLHGQLLGLAGQDGAGAAQGALLGGGLGFGLAALLGLLGLAGLLRVVGGGALRLAPEVRAFRLRLGRLLLDGRDDEGAAALGGGLLGPLHPSSLEAVAVEVALLGPVHVLQLLLLGLGVLGGLGLDGAGLGAHGGEGGLGDARRLPAGVHRRLTAQLWWHGLGHGRYLTRPHVSRLWPLPLFGRLRAE